MSQRVLDIYEALLKTAGLQADKDGFIQYNDGQAIVPVTIKKKRLVLPTPKQKAYQGDDIDYFNPLHENALRDESAVVTYYRKALNLHLNHVFALIMITLVRKAASPKEHAQLTPDQAEYLSKVKDIDEKTFQNLEKLITAMGSNPLRSFVSIYLKPAGEWRGKKYNRVGVISFPLYEELKKNGEDVFGVKIQRKKDIASFISLLEYMIPAIDEPEAHNFGSNVHVGPFMHAMMNAFLTVGGPLNALIDLFSNIIEDAENIKFNSDWVEAMEDTDPLGPEVRKLGNLPGNEGSHLSPEEQDKKNQQNQPVARTWNAPAQTPAWQAPATQTPQVATGKRSFESIMGSVPPPQHQGWNGGYQPQQRQNNTGLRYQGDARQNSYNSGGGGWNSGGYNGRRI